MNFNPPQPVIRRQRGLKLTLCIPEPLKKFCGHLNLKRESGLFEFWRRWPVAGHCGHALSPKPRQNSKILASNGRRISLMALAAFLLIFLGGATQVHAQAQAPAAPGGFNLNIGVNGLNNGQDVDSAIKVVVIMTLLTLAPSIILLMTCFTRIVIVLSFVRSALSLQ